MNKLLVFFVVSFFALLGMHAYAEAQTIAVAEDFVIQIPTDKPLEANYTLDISGLNFDNETQREQFVSMWVANLYEVTLPDPAAQPHLCNLELRLAYQSDWNQAEWNTFLESLSAEWVYMYNKIKSH
ncbi:MAG: hypothetical protein JJT94_16825 [Bernardetiaceae bacterium]|nr:hypothetical protein [Bernardetiaceae bacterium]